MDVEVRKLRHGKAGLLKALMLRMYADAEKRSDDEWQQMVRVLSA